MKVWIKVDLDVRTNHMKRTRVNYFTNIAK